MKYRFHTMVSLGEGVYDLHTYIKMYLRAHTVLSFIFFGVRRRERGAAVVS